jgi:hypothetical protein
MKKIIITLTEQQANNLVYFLQSAHLTGKEVPSYVELINAINAAENLDVEQPKNLASEDEKK